MDLRRRQVELIIRFDLVSGKPGGLLKNLDRMSIACSTR